MGFLVLSMLLAQVELPLDGGLAAVPEVPGDAAPVAMDAGVGPGERQTTVVAARVVDLRRVAGSAQVLGREELERNEANDVHQVLRAVPGVYVREEEGLGLRPNIGMRGVNADRSAKVTLLEDGLPLAPAPYTAASAYFFPLVTRMVALEVFKGPAAIRFGPQTVGGALNLITRPVPQQLEGDLDLALGSHGLGKAHGVVGWGTEQLGVLLEGVRLQGDGFRQLDGRGPTGFVRHELMLKARAATDPSAPVHHALSLKLGLANEESHEGYVGLSPEDFAATPLRRYAATAPDLMRWWRTQASLTHVLTVGSWLELETSLYRNDFERGWERLNGFAQGPDLFSLLGAPAAGSRWRDLLAGEADSATPAEGLLYVDQRRRFVSQGVQLGARARFATGPVEHELELGVRGHHDDVVRDHRELTRVMRSGVPVPDGTPWRRRADNVAFTRALAVHLADTLTVGRLLIAPGARLEVMQLGASDHLTGAAGTSVQVVPLVGLGAVYAFESGLSVLAGVHQGFSPVAPGQRPEVRAEQAVNSELGLRFGRAGVRAELIGFWSEYANITGECTASMGCVGDQLNTQYNGGAARVLGLEAMASARAQVGAGVTVSGEFSYTFTQARFLQAFKSDNSIWGTVSAGDELPYVPVHQGQLRVRAARGPFELGLGAGLVGDVRERAGQGPLDPSVTVPLRVLLDAQASAEFGGARVYATVTNLSNQPALAARRPFGARAVAPLMVQVGFKYAFR